MTRWPLTTIGRWVKQVPWLVRTNFRKRCTWRFPSPSRTTICSPVTDSTTPSAGDSVTWPESRAVRSSIPVPTSGADGFRSGTAWRCMLVPIRARLASSCSRNGISEPATDIVCLGETSM